MKPIIIVGAGGFGREVEYLIETINEASPTWDIKGYVDDSVPAGTKIGNSSVLGNLDYLKRVDTSVSLVIAIGSAKTRKKIYERIDSINVFNYPNLIDSEVRVSKRVTLGKGCIICAGCLLTVDITLGDFVILNLGCTVGHDAQIAEFVTVYPSVNISGRVSICCNTEVGTGTQIIQGTKVAESCIVGAGTVIVKDIEEQGTYVGVPARKVK